MGQIMGSMGGRKLHKGRSIQTVYAWGPLALETNMRADRPSLPEPCYSGQ